MGKRPAHVIIECSPTELTCWRLSKPFVVSLNSRLICSSPVSFVGFGQAAAAAQADLHAVDVNRLVGIASPCRSRGIDLLQLTGLDQLQVGLAGVLGRSSLANATGQFSQQN